MSKQIASNLPRSIKTSYYALVVFSALLFALSLAWSFLETFFRGNYFSYLTISNAFFVIVFSLPIFAAIFLNKKTSKNRWDKFLLMFFICYQLAFAVYLLAAPLFMLFISWVILSILFKYILDLSSKGAITMFLLILDIVLIFFLFSLTQLEFFFFIAIVYLLMAFLGILLAFIVRDIYILHKRGEFFKKLK